MFKSIQIACSTFFEEYDRQMVKYEANFEDINMKYQDWSMCLIQPQTLNDAKLYVLESRIIEEEKVRLKEFQIVQENWVKLIYAFQQDVEGQNKPVETPKAAGTIKPCPS